MNTMSYKKGDVKREQIYSFIVAYLAQEQRAPTTREIWKACGLSGKSHVIYHLDILERQGLLVRPSNIHRAIRLQNGETHNDEVELVHNQDR